MLIKMPHRLGKAGFGCFVAATCAKVNNPCAFLEQKYLSNHVRWVDFGAAQ